MRDPFRFPVTTLGRAAGERLAPGRRGRVLAVFRRSFYVEMDDGALACIGPEGMGAGPLNALSNLPAGIDWQASGLAPDTACHVEGDAIVIGERFQFDFDEAVPWRPSRPGPWSPATLAAGLATLYEYTAAYDLTEGLAALAGPVSDGDNPVIRAARPSLTALRGWIETNDGGQPPPDAIGLIGLGTGLTPSGDDFIGGALIALRAFGRSNTADLLARWVLPLAAEKTGKISAAHLACAAMGEGAAALHDVIVEICAEDRPGLKGSLPAIDAIGHSSGWDALAGAAAVIAAIADPE